MQLQDIQHIADENEIEDISDYFGKTLVLQKILESMDKDEANQFMLDTFDMLQDEIEACEVKGKGHSLSHIFGAVYGELDGIRLDYA